MFAESHDYSARRTPLALLPALPPSAGGGSKPKREPKPKRVPLKLVPRTGDIAPMLFRLRSLLADDVLAAPGWRIELIVGAPADGNSAWMHYAVAHKGRVFVLDVRGPKVLAARRRDLALWLLESGFCLEQSRLYEAARLTTDEEVRTAIRIK